MRRAPSSATTLAGSYSPTIGASRIGQRRRSHGRGRPLVRIVVVLDDVVVVAYDVVVLCIDVVVFFVFVVARFVVRVFVVVLVLIVVFFFNDRRFGRDDDGRGRIRDDETPRVERRDRREAGRPSTARFGCGMTAGRLNASRNVAGPAGFGAALGFGAIAAARSNAPAVTDSKRLRKRAPSTIAMPIVRLTDSPEIHTPSASANTTSATFAPAPPTSARKPFCNSVPNEPPERPMNASTMQK